MRRLTLLFSFYLFILSLAPNFEGHELLKLPTLVMHFIEHKSENKNITFSEFMHIHYLHGNTIDNDRDRDMQLPFKSPGTCLPATSIAFVTHSIPEFSFQSFPVIVSVISVTEVTFQSFQSLCNIWQPPKAA